MELLIAPSNTILKLLVIFFVMKLYAQINIFKSLVLLKKSYLTLYWFHLKLISDCNDFLRQNIKFKLIY